MRHAGRLLALTVCVWSVSASSSCAESPGRSPNEEAGGAVDAASPPDGAPHRQDGSNPDGAAKQDGPAPKPDSQVPKPDGAPGAVVTYGQVYTGGEYHLGPVDWDETQWHNACAPDNGQWTCLGSRHDRNETYGWGPIAPVLRDLNCDIIFVLFPLDVVPAEAVDGDPHLPRAGQDYRLNESRLPSGEVLLDEVRIRFR